MSKEIFNYEDCRVTRDNISEYSKKLDSVLFMISLSNWCNNKFPEKDKRGYFHLAYKDDFYEVLNDLDNITFCRFNNFDSVTEAINQIIKNRKYEEFVKVYLGVKI